MHGMEEAPDTTCTNINPLLLPELFGALVPLLSFLLD